MTDGAGWDIASSVGLTALAVAGGRALESSRDDALITDPLAPAFLRAARSGNALPDLITDADDADPLWRYMTNYLALRTRFLDDHLAAVRPTQVVILAAGLDARACRLSWPPGCVLFEVDQPKVLDFKQEVLDDVGAQPRCRRHVVRTDLREDWVTALLDAGFDRNTPTAWLAEGLLPYLPAAAEEALFDTVHQLSAPGSTIAAERMDTTALHEITHHPLFPDPERFDVDLAALWSIEPRRDCAGWLRSAGWQVAETGVADMERRHARETMPRELIDQMSTAVFVTATMQPAG